jgi:decaprenylphospho-beta-D-ribofuranose 2-oxidase
MHTYATRQQIADLVTCAGRRGLIVRGLGRSYGDAAQNAGGLVVELDHSPAGLIVDRDSASVTVSAGASLDALLRQLVPQGYFVPVSPGTRHVTVGGAVAADIHGKNHHVDGSIGRHIRRLEVVDGTGAVRCLDAASTPGEFWATTGGMGLTGVIVRATLSLRQVETSWVRVETKRTTSLDESLAAMADDDAYTYSVAWIDLLATGRSLGRGVLTRGVHASAGEVPRSHARRPLDFAPRQPLTAPPTPSRLAVNPVTVRAFNEFWYRRAPRRRQTTIQSIEAFFHPLDAVGHWNRLYGRRGLVQYQLAVPTRGEGALADAVRLIAESGHASFLAVLKRFGSGTPAPLSFPMAGWTLALDLPATPSLAGLLDALDSLVVEAGGRVYLAKDARARPDVIARMYPRLDEFREVRARLDPDGIFQSDLSRRLRL